MNANTEMPAGLLYDSLTVLWGDWLELRSRLTQVIASGLISPLIYILAFGYGLGSTLDGATFGGSYLSFILPGMAALSSMTISFGGTTFSICGDRLYSKTFEEMLLAPISPLALYLGKMLAGVLRGLLTAGAVVVVAILFTGNWRFLHPAFWLLLTLNGMVFAGLGAIVGLKVASLEAVGLANNFAIVPMSFLGGTFFDPSRLAGPLQVLVYALPLTHTSSGLRAIVRGEPLSWIHVLVLTGVALGLAWVGGRLFATQRD